MTASARWSSRPLAVLDVARGVLSDLDPDVVLERVIEPSRKPDRRTVRGARGPRSLRWRA
jgi:hypothetical protein